MTTAPRLDNLKTTYKRYVAKAHPASCPTCALIWGKKGAPQSFEDYAARYPALEHGAKRHLTQDWNPGLTFKQVADQAECDPEHVQEAFDNGMLEAADYAGTLYVSQTNATLWIKAGAPAGDSVKSWVSLEGAFERYGFSEAEVLAFIAAGRLKRYPGETDPPGAILVSRRQCWQLRDELGYTPEHAAARLGVRLSDLPGLLEGLEWRPADGLIPLAVIRSAAKRLGGASARPAPADINRPGWLVAHDAAALAGISKSTLSKWAEEGKVDRQYEAGGFRYKASDVKAAARDLYLKYPDKPGRPEWLIAELESKASKKSTSGKGS
ncbi:DNA-binding XRE family transcriptional regulator [Roseateles asaccharophilus]|uniref:hypothetical protein n=1 Tax=Roseateles asaccharophilus TaxID=582607 RepID=UPI0038369CE9